MTKVFELTFATLVLFVATCIVVGCDGGSRATTGSLLGLQPASPSAGDTVASGTTDAQKQSDHLDVTSATDEEFLDVATLIDGEFEDATKFRVGSCYGWCGGFSKDGCACDSDCVDRDDCCQDFLKYCIGSCVGRCGGFSIEGCSCDEICIARNDCCYDYEDYCSEGLASCDGNCGFLAPGGCSCAPECYSQGNCCPDIGEYCETPANSCYGYCGDEAPAGCWCDESCFDFGDCCDDVMMWCDYEMVTVKIHSAVIAPFKYDGCQWDGLTCDKAAEKMIAKLATTLAGLSAYDVVDDATRNAIVSILSPWDKPDPFGTLNGSDLEPIQDTLTPIWSGQELKLNLTSNVLVEIELWDEDIKNHDPIGIATLGYAELAWVREFGKSVHLYVGDQTNNQLISVQISVK